MRIGKQDQRYSAISTSTPEAIIVRHTRCAVLETEPVAKVFIDVRNDGRVVDVQIGRDPAPDRRPHENQRGDTLGVGRREHRRYGSTLRHPQERRLR